MGPHFEDLIHSIKVNISNKTSALRALELKYVGDGSLEDLSDQDYGSYLKERRSIENNYFGFVPKVVQTYNRALSKELKTIVDTVNRELQPYFRDLSTPEKKVLYLKTQQEKIKDHLSKSFPELANQLKLVAGETDYSFQLAKGSGVHTPGYSLIPTFHHKFSYDMTKALRELDPRAATQLHQRVADSMKYSYLDACKFLTEKGYQTGLAFTGSIGKDLRPAFLASREEEQKDTDSILGLFGKNPLNWVITKGPFRGKTLGYVQGLLEKESPHHQKLKEDVNKAHQALRATYAGDIKNIQSEYQAKRDRIAAKYEEFVSRMGGSSVSMERMKAQLEKLSKNEQQDIQKLVREKEKNLKESLHVQRKAVKAIELEKRKAAMWLLNTHATIMTSPEQFGIYFGAKGKLTKHGGITKAFRLVFTQADRMHDLVGSAEHYMGLDKQRPEDGDMDLTYLRSRFFKDARGVKRKTESAYRKLGMPKEGEGFAVSDVGKQRVYKSKRRDPDPERARQQLMEEYGLTGRHSMFKGLMSTMDPNTRNKFQRVMDRLSRLPGRPEKGKPNDGPLMMRMAKDGSLYYETIKDEYSLARKYLYNTANRLKQEAAKKTGVQVYSAMSIVEDYLEKKAKRSYTIDDILKAGSEGLNVAKGGKIRGRKNMEMALINKENFSELIAGAKSHEELQKVEQFIYESIYSGSGLAKVFDPRSSKDKNFELMRQAVDLSQVLPYGLSSKDTLSEDYLASRGPLLTKDSMQSMVQGAITGNYKGETVEDFYERQAQVIGKSPMASSITPSLPVGTQIRLRRAELNNEGSTI